ncbi:hypothetical protein GUJ93_ZPchr0001g30772 [Zizania palustris]|uniref:Uncharacterized protein n=1 Tax=Zizania palustris TaxID=103762 RepID=A0A8J5V8C3_ZIZPA|nr:hypothetical protein GUJ93_ZPchr0001g30772 [Zizania palustris]
MNTIHRLTGSATTSSSSSSVGSGVCIHDQTWMWTADTTVPATVIFIYLVMDFYLLIVQHLPSSTVQTNVLVFPQVIGFSSAAGHDACALFFFNFCFL